MHLAHKCVALILWAALFPCLAVPELRDHALLGLLMPIVFIVVIRYDPLEFQWRQFWINHTESTARSNAVLYALLDLTLLGVVIPVSRPVVIDHEAAYGTALRITPTEATRVVASNHLIGR